MCRCRFLLLELASFASVREFVRRLAVAQPGPLHLLLLNAALFGLPLTRTQDGLEQMMQVNFGVIMVSAAMRLMFRPRALCVVSGSIPGRI